jgi:hypothetical protein
MRSDLQIQDIFLYAVIVPVVPFALRSRAGIAEDQGIFYELDT